MPRYFIDTNDGDSLVRDEDGFTTDDIETARILAIDALPDMARDKLPDGDARSFTVSVRDEVGGVVYSAELVFRGRWSP